MKHFCTYFRSQCRWSTVAPLFSMVLCLFGTGRRVQAQENSTAKVEALLYSTMPSRAIHRPTMAMDGDQNTYFRSEYGMGDGDDFLVLLSQPIPVQSIQITTGDTEGADTLTNGVVETSPDGIHYSTLR